MSTRQILLTGATRGLGRAMAEGFARHGCRVDGCGRDAEALTALAALGPEHAFEAVDVSDGVQVETWAERLLAAGRVPDLVLNNAALINQPAPLWQVGEEEFSRLVDVNIKGVVNVVRAFLPAMIERGSGVVVNFSSGWGRSTAPEVAPYCATKFAIEGLTRALAQELPEGLAAVPLNPGIIHTEMLETAFGASAAQFPAPEVWAEQAVPFLLGLGVEDNGRLLTAPG